MIVINSICCWLLHFTVIIPSDSSTSSSLYPWAFVGCWCDLRRDTSFSYLHIILVLGIFQGLCGVEILSGKAGGGGAMFSLPLGH
jgi:hypothetical protein